MAQQIIKKSRVHLEASSAAVEAPEVTLLHATEPALDHGRKTVRLLEESGMVHGIEFTCGCGEVTAVELVYPGHE